jgi:TPR repeat protein
LDLGLFIANLNHKSNQLIICIYMGLLGNIFKMTAVASSGKKIERCLKNAEAGDAESQYTIGIQYERGQFGFPQDLFEAAKWYRKAAIQGHAGAQLYLGVFLAQGQGVEPDIVEAYKWIELAKRGSALDKIAANGCQKRLVAFMTPEQIAEGQRLSSEFVPKKGNAPSTTN